MTDRFTLPSESRFPIEIYEEIIRWVHLLFGLPPRLSIEERQIKLSALRSCALTCRAWLPVSRACLYSNCTLYDEDKTSLDYLVRSLDANPWLRTLVTQLDIHITFITTRAKPDSPSGHHSTSYKPSDLILDTWPLILAGKLPRLNTLHVALTVNLTRHPQSIRSMQTFSAVTTLSLDWRDSTTSADLVRVLAVFPNLQSVSLTGILVRATSVRQAIQPRRFPAPSRLFLRDGFLTRRLIGRYMMDMLLQMIAHSVRILGVGHTAIPYTLLDGQTTNPQALPCLQTFHYFGSLPGLADRIENVQLKDIVNWALLSAPALRQLVFNFARPPASHMKCRLVRRLVQTMVGIQLAENILPYLPYTTRKITLLLCDDFFPREMERHVVLASTAIVCVRRTVARFERCPEVNVVWSGLTGWSSTQLPLGALSCT
ncbi:hypothetical protein C8Q73DRAFT_710720 [Cubamyces lactineus]|nr:hypothetical protein C8Q73DRAFT_710720 [Cubamyces lactineus]